MLREDFRFRFPHVFRLYGPDRQNVPDNLRERNRAWLEKGVQRNWILSAALRFSLFYFFAGGSQSAIISSLSCTRPSACQLSEEL